MVFLGEDLMHTRDYSEDTARVVDAEVSRILRRQEERAIELLSRHRGGLDAVARGLLERETLDGEEVGRLVDTAYGSPVHAAGSTVVPHFAPSEDPPAGIDAPSANGENSENSENSENGENGSYVEASPAAKPTGSTAGTSSD
jgi:cell division protease FtsH